MASLLSRLLGWGRRQAVEREAEEEQMSPAERRYAQESVVGHQADTFVEEHGMAALPPIDLDDEFRAPRP